MPSIRRENRLLADIVEANGGVVTNKDNRAKLLNDWLDSYLISPRWYWNLNGASYAEFEKVLTVSGDFYHEFSGVFSPLGFHLLSDNNTNASGRVILFADTKIMYAGISSQVLQLSDAEYNALTDGNIHTIKYGRVGADWFLYDNGVSIGSLLAGAGGVLTFNNFGDQFGRSTSIPNFTGVSYNHIITGADMANYPTGELIIPFNEPFGSHAFAETSNNTVGVKYNDVEADYSQTLP